MERRGSVEKGRIGRRGESEKGKRKIENKWRSRW